jgi:2-haloalkanoic acid dehalogenase type II
MNPLPGLITFDCYGTLIDWETGILTALRAAYPEAAAIGDDALLGAFHAAQDARKTAAYRSYRDLLTEVAVDLAATYGWDGSPALAGTLPASVPTWTPFDDTNAALGRLVEAGIPLGILSNIDDDLLAGTLGLLTGPFERIGTAQRLRSYKPARVHFDLGLEWAQGRAGGWLHVAQSLFHDIEPATRLRVPCLWVNRKDEALPSSVAPRFVAPDLESAVEWILGD